jgi:hypothetical protein
MLRQKRIEAKLIAEKNAEKSKNVVKCGANLHSQWGRVVQNESRLIDNGHYMKSAERAKLDYYREEIRKAKNAAKKENELIIVKRR